MECQICKEEVWCLNNTSEGEACYNCRKKLGLKIIPYKIKKVGDTEFLTKSQFASKKIKEREGGF